MCKPFACLKLVLLTLVLVACGNGAAAAPADVIYEAGANDEAWLEMDAATPIVDDALAPRLTAPTGAIAVDGPIVSFEWAGGAVDDGASARAPAAHAGRGLLARVAREFFPVARAHGPPANGPIYRLELGFGEMVDPVRVLTGRARYMPDPAVWSRIREARRTHGVLRMHVVIVGAFFRAGRISEGPYARTTAAQIGLE